MFRAFLIFVALNTASVYLVHQILDSFQINGGPLAFVLIGVIIGALNLFVKPILKILSLPFIFLTAGLFVIVINGLILWLTELTVSFLNIGNISLTINGPGTYLAAIVLLGLSNYIFQKIIR